MAHHNGEDQRIGLALGFIIIKDSDRGFAQLALGFQGHKNASCGSQFSHGITQNFRVGDDNGEVFLLGHQCSAVRVQVKAVQILVGDTHFLHIVRQDQLQVLVFGQLLTNRCSLPVLGHIGLITVITLLAIGSIEPISCQLQSLGGLIAHLNRFLRGPARPIAQLALIVKAPIPDIVIALDHCTISIAQSYAQRALKVGGFLTVRGIRQALAFVKASGHIGVGQNMLCIQILPAQLLVGVGAPKVHIPAVTRNGRRYISPCIDTIDLAAILTQCNGLGESLLLVPGSGILFDNFHRNSIDLLKAGDGIVDPVAMDATAQLAVSIAAPAINCAICHQRYAMAGARSNIHRTVERCSVGPQHHFYRRMIAKGDLNFFIIIVGIIAYTQLAVGVITPAQHGAVRPKGQYMIAAGSKGNNIAQIGLPAGTPALIDLSGRCHIAGILRHKILGHPACNLIFSQVFHRCQIIRIVQIYSCIGIAHVRVRLFLTGIANTQLTIFIVTPTPNFTALGQKHGEVIPSVHGQAILRKSGHHNSGGLESTGGSLAQLAMEIIAPSIHSPVLSQSQGMIPASSHRNNILQVFAVRSADPLRTPCSCLVVDAQLPKAVITPSPNSAVGFQDYREGIAAVQHGGSHQIVALILIHHFYPQNQGTFGSLIIDSHSGDTRVPGSQPLTGNRNDPLICTGQFSLTTIVFICSIRCFLQQELQNSAFCHSLEGNAVTNIEPQPLGYQSLTPLAHQLHLHCPISASLG